MVQKFGIKKTLIILVLLLVGFSNVSLADEQTKRKEIINQLINEYRIFDKIDIPGIYPRVYVSNNFKNLSFSDKFTFIHIVYSYYYTLNSKYDFIVIIDSLTDEDIGGYDLTYGLKFF